MTSGGLGIVLTGFAVVLAIKLIRKPSQSDKAGGTLLLLVGGYGLLISLAVTFAPLSG